MEGIYAFALWDRVRRELILARDPIGVKPLYIADDGRAIRFASEVKALAVGRDFQTRIAAEGAASLLALGHVNPDRSILSGVSQIPAGTVRSVNANGVSDHTFWHLRRVPEILSMAAAREEFVPLFEKVVSEQLVSDVPVAVLQSGGIDSSLISLALPRDTAVRLYNVRFPDRDFDESGAAADFAAIAGHPLEFLDLDGSDDEQDFRNVVRALDGGLADSSALATYRLSRRIRDAATIALYCSKSEMRAEK